MRLHLNLALAVILVCLGAIAPARAVDEAINADVNGNFEAMSAEDRAWATEVERTVDWAARSPELPLRILTARWWPTQRRINSPVVHLPTIKELADESQGSTDPYVLAVMGAICRSTNSPECDANTYLRRSTEVSPQDARAWLNLAIWERSQGHEDASVQAFKQIAAATDLSDLHAMGLQIVISTTKSNEWSPKDRAILVFQAGETASMITLSMPNPADRCRADSALRPACNHLVSLLSNQGSLLDLTLAGAIAKQLPTSTQAELRQNTMNKKAYAWVLEMASVCYMGQALYSTTAPGCPTETWLTGIITVGELRYARAELQRRGISVADAATAYDRESASAH